MVAIAALVGFSTVPRSGGGEPEQRRVSASLASAQAPADTSGFGRAPIEGAIRKLVADVKMWGGTVGVAVIDVSTGQALAMLNEHAAFNPASNAKLATAAAAIGLLGPQRRFQTGLYGKISGETVEELSLRGDGDPSLETRDLWAMATDLRAAGVRRVQRISVDQSFFDDRYVPPAFDQQPNEWASFRAPVAPVSLNENTVLFQVHSMRDGNEARVDVDPPGFVDLLSSVITSKKGSPEKVALGLEAQGARLTATLSGSLPEGSRLFSVIRRVDDPRLLAGYALRALLKQIGIDVSSEVRLGGEKQKALLVKHRSAELGALIAALGKDSNNFYAEMLFKAIGAERKRPGTADSASIAVEDYLKDRGAFDQGVIVKNGSGLFDANRITPWAAAYLLRQIYLDPRVGPDFVAHLSIGGVDGTLHSRFRRWATRRIVRAKTGTLESVAALSGYILPPPGRSPLAFSILINGIPGKVSAARKSIDEVVRTSADALWAGSDDGGTSNAVP